MSRQFLCYWRPEQIERALGDGIEYIASNQLRDVRADDVVWIVGTSERGRLITLGPVDVGRVCSKTEVASALNVSPDSLWQAEHYVLPRDGAVKQTTTVDLTTVAAELRFVSKTSPHLDVRGGKVNAQQLQRRREPTAKSVRLLLRLWNQRSPRGLARLPASELHKVSAEQLWSVRERLLRRRDYTPFDDSDVYDVLLEDGQRLPPKALFGKALSIALGREVGPNHFTGGESSTCFRVLRRFGYDIVLKGEANTVNSGPDIDREWIEGSKKLRSHLSAERRHGLAVAKREQFIREHGRLYCEECGFDPIKAYGAEHGAACIEVHHARLAVAAMRPGHLTKLGDLKCLCANCHRVEHKRMRSRAA